MPARKTSRRDIEADPKLWFKPYCKKCGLLFDDYNEFLEHCEKEHWRKPEVDV